MYRFRIKLTSHFKKSKRRRQNNVGESVVNGQRKATRNVSFNTITGDKFAYRTGIERSADGVNTTEKERRLKLSWNKKNDSEVLINKIPFSFFLQLRLNEIIHEHIFSVSHSFSDNTITCLPIQTVRAFCLASLFPVNFLFIFFFWHVFHLKMRIYY